MRRVVLVIIGTVLGLPVVAAALSPFPAPDIVAEVTGVADGETINVRLVKVPQALVRELTVGATESIRYIGVEAPEPQQPGGPEATALNTTLVLGRRVYLELDDVHRDDYGRLLTYVYLDAEGYLMVNLVLISTPIIGTRAYPGTERYAPVFKTVDQAQPPKCNADRVDPLFLEIVSVTSPVSAGSHATLRARTLPGTDCTITVTYKSGPSSAGGLGPKQADAQGFVSWSWFVSRGTTPGEWPIVVTASLCGQITRQETKLAVQ